MLLRLQVVLSDLIYPTCRSCFVNPHSFTYTIWTSYSLLITFGHLLLSLVTILLRLLLYCICIYCKSFKLKKN